MATKTEPNEILQSVAPQLDAVAKNLLQQVYGEEGLRRSRIYRISKAGCVTMNIVAKVCRSPVVILNRL